MGYDGSCLVHPLHRHSTTQTNHKQNADKSRHTTDAHAHMGDTNTPGKPRWWARSVCICVCEGRVGGGKVTGKAGQGTSMWVWRGVGGVQERCDAHNDVFLVLILIRFPRLHTR